MNTYNSRRYMHHETCDDGDSDSYGRIGSECEASMSPCLSTLIHSKMISPLSSSSTISVCDGGHGDDSTSTSLPLTPSNQSIDYSSGYHRCRGFMEILLSVVAITLLLPMFIAVTDFTESSRSNTAISLQNGLVVPNASSLSLAKHRFRSHRARLLQVAATDTIITNSVDPNNSTANDTETAPPTIIVEVAAGETKEDVDIDEQINANNNTTNGTAQPTLIVELQPGETQDNVDIDGQTTSDTIDDPTESIEDESNVSNEVSSVSPTAIPGISEPMRTSAPTPSSSMSHSPIGALETMTPTLPTLRPSKAPSIDPTISPSPTKSSEPSVAPTSSMVPSSTPSISSAPTTPTLTITNFDNRMRLINVPQNLNLTTEEIEIWQNVTTQHMKDYFQAVDETYTSDWSMEVIDVGTEFVEEVIIEQTVGDDIDRGPSHRQDQSQNVPHINPVRIPGTQIVDIHYNQWVTYRFNGDERTRDALIQEFFVKPFTTDSFDYTIDLFSRLKWTTWVRVEYIEEGRRETVQKVTIRTKVARSTILISIGIVSLSIIIVVFLLWDRTNMKVNANAATNNQGTPEISPADSGGQATLVTETIHNGTGMSWNSGPFYDNGSMDPTFLSIRSAPSHLRRNSVERARSDSRDSLEGIARGRLGSKDNPFPSSKGASHRREKSAHSRISSASGSIDYIQEMSPNRDETFESPGIPKQIRSTSTGAIITTRISSNAGSRPFLPPLPPPSAFGSPERRPENSLDNGFFVSLNDQSSDDAAANARSTSFRRVSRGGFNMRVSGIDMRVSGLSEERSAEISLMMDPFASDRPPGGNILNLGENSNSNMSAITQLAFPSSGRASNDGIIVPQNSDLAYGGAPAVRSVIPQPARSHQILSPLHIPDEEHNDVAATDLATLTPPRNSPVPMLPTLNTMLGLESRPPHDALATSQSGFAITVSNIEDDLEQ